MHDFVVRKEIDFDEVCRTIRTAIVGGSYNRRVILKIEDAPSTAQVRVGNDKRSSLRIVNSTLTARSSNIIALLAQDQNVKDVFERLHRENKCMPVSRWKNYFRPRTKVRVDNPDLKKHENNI